MQFTFGNIAIISLPNIIIFGMGLYLKSYINQKGKNLATKEDIGKVTDEIEQVKILYNKDLSEYNVRLEKFKKVQEIRIDIFNRLAKIKLDAFTLDDLHLLDRIDIQQKKKEWEKINASIYHALTNMKVYGIFLLDCKKEIDELRDNYKLFNSNSTSDERNKFMSKLDALMSKIMDHKNKDVDK